MKRLTKRWLSISALICAMATLAGAQTAIYVPPAPTISNVPGLSQALIQSAGRQVVATHSEIATTSISNATDLNDTSRVKMTVKYSCNSFQLLYSNFRVTGATTTDTAGANSITVKAALEDGSGNILPVWFFGQRTVTIPPGGYVYSDPVMLPCAAGSTLWVRSMPTVTTGQTWCNNYVTQVANGEGVVVNTDSVDGTAITASFSNAYGPQMVIARLSGGRQRSVLVIGDSIAAGTGDTGTTDANSGYITRSLSAANVAWARIAVGGDRVQFFSSPTKSWLRMLSSTGCNCAIVEYGINDVTNLQTTAQIKTSLLAAWAAAARCGMTVYQCTITPVSTSTDFWGTVAGQTTEAHNATRTAINDWIRAPASAGAGNSAILDAGGNLTGYFETADVAETSRNSGIWAVSTFATGTATGATTTVLTDSGKSFTASALVGKVLKYTSGAANGLAKVVTANTSTTVTTAAFGSTPAIGDTYEIDTPATADGTHPNPGMHILLSAAVTPSSMSFRFATPANDLADLLVSTVFHTRRVYRRAQ